MNIMLIDQDPHYATALKYVLLKTLPNLTIMTFPSPQALADSSAGSEKEDAIILYTEEQFPDYRPKLNSIALHAETSFLEQSLDPNTLYRLGSVDKIIKAVQLWLEENTHSLSTLPGVSTYLFTSWNAAIQRFFHRRIKETALAGKKTLMVEMGPAILFTQSSAPPTKNFLLDLSLRKVESATFGQYLEMHPHNPGIQRLTLPFRSDDWILCPEALIRESLQLFHSWAESLYGSDWELFIVSCYMPFQLNKAIAGISKELTTVVSGRVPNEALWQKELSQLIGLMPSGSQHSVLNIT